MTDDIARGLEGVTVAETRLSSIDGEAGELTIGGFPLPELAGNATFEETVFLLREDRLPDADEFESIRADLASRRDVEPETLETLRAAAEDGLPAMDALRMGVAAATLGGEASTAGDPADDALTAVAVMPTLVAAYWRYHEGDEPVAPREDLGHAANYLHMLNDEEPDEARVRGLETYLNSVVDHGLNASTFTARCIASTESDVVSAVTGAVGALKGPLHGGAPGPVLDMLLDVHESGDPEAAVRDRLEAGERLMGFGHRVYEVRDPRAAVLSDAAESFYGDAGDADFFESAREAERVGVEALAEHKPGRRLETNVEFYTAVLLHGIGVPRELFTATFGVARVGGWTAHCLEQLADNRIIRPRARYVGETNRTWVPVSER
ncbi:citrate synthase/methylcitrate synthase [Halorarum salinum]|uniref:Citrate synthase n=1 Tax=Halorarum salinum TaxID=2743089 RepID=A0A7D5QHY9_9EURY|nr:citrate synthase/methylcitrate synthase [Halobaculum salinum]QLG62564.1 citrate synthase/methylcitrate synthase [Halobaculum salinum]